MAITRTPAKAKKPRYETLGLAARDLLKMYETMLLARSLDERMWLLQRQGKAAFLVSCQGHEGAQIGFAAALQPGTDVVLPYYRDLGVVLWMGMTPRAIMLNLMARADDPNSGGKQMPMHWSARRLNIVTGSSPVSTQIPHAAGVALAIKYRREPAVAATFFGDGGASKGDFHEGLNFAAIHRLPVVFVCENNGYAISVPVRKQMAVASVAERAAGYGMPGESVDGNDVLAVYEAARRAVQRARSGDGPTLLEFRVQRFTAHSSDDDDRTYRAAEELAQVRSNDPLAQFRAYLEEEGVLTPDVAEAIAQRVGAAVDDATDFAEAAPLPQPEEAFRNVYGPTGTGDGASLAA